MSADKQYRASKQIRMKKASSNVTASFVLGILSIVLCAVPLMLIGSVIGLMLEKESERWDYHSLQTPAKVLCIIGTVLCSLMIAALIVAYFVFRILSKG